MTRVMHLVAGAEHGGAETFSADIICALADAGVEQTVVARPWPDRLAQYGRHCVPVVPFGFRGPPILGRRRIGDLVRARRPDVVFAWMSRAATFLPRVEVPTVGWLGGYYDLKRFRSCDWLVGVTRDIARHLVHSGVPPARARTIHTYAELDAAPPVDRAALATPADAVVTVALARLHPKKGLDTLIRALALLPERHMLWLAGEGELRPALERLVGELGLGTRVRFLGWRRDRAALIGAADIVALPSRYEPFGTVILEAWAGARPLVAARALGPAAYVRDGVDGLLVEIDDAGGLAAAIGRVADEPALAAALVAGAGARYRAEFTKAACIAHYRALIEEVAGGR